MRKPFLLLLALLFLAACDPNRTELPPGALQPPANIMAVGGHGLVEVSWDPSPSSGVTGYNVYRAQAQPVALTADNRLNADEPLPATGNFRFYDDRVENGVTYYYVVTAIGAGNRESAASVTRAATPQAVGLERPRVTGVRPADGTTGVALDIGIGADPRLPNSGIDINTMNSSTVRLIRVDTGQQVPGNPGTSGGFDTITLQPDNILAANTTYRFEVTEGLRDQNGAAFIPFSSTFATGADPNGGTPSPVAFEQVALSNTHGEHYTSLVVGPDNRLYASTILGEIHRYPIRPDGTLGARFVINTIPAKEGAPRLLIGLTFDPAATSSNLELWTSHTQFAADRGNDWTGKITKLSGPDLETAQDFVIGLPRSTKDHVTNSLAFGPSGAMYVSQGANTAMGAPDSTWGWRPERLLTAAVLRIDVGRITSPPLDVRTPEGGGSYNPFAPNAPLTIYASGVRNAYDLVWHSNGQLYVPTNGSGPGGNMPRSPATVSELPEACNQRLDGQLYTGPFITNANVTARYVHQEGNPDVGGYRIPRVQNDYLFRVEQGGYYGHPNPTRCEYAFFGGNPQNAPASSDLVPEYRPGVPTDPNYRGFAYDFGANPSTNGIIEYRSNTFGGALRGKLLVVRFALGDDIVVMTPGPGGGIVETATRLDGMFGFLDPLTLTENPLNGHLYVSEFNRQVSGLSLEDDESGSFLEVAQSGSGPRITLLRPVENPGN